LSVSELSAGVGSVVPPGAATVAVFAMSPAALAAAVVTAVNVAEPEASRSTVVAMLPLPPGLPHAEPAVAEHVQATFVRSAGNVSVTAAPVTASGPAFDTLIVYVSVSPGAYCDLPSVLVMPRFAAGVRVSVSLAVSFPGTGSVVPAGGATVAVFERAPTAARETVPVARNVALPPFSRLTVVSMSPAPPPLEHEEPALAAHVHVTLWKEAGKVSTTAAPATALGPAFEATIV
jgi:hypothetical protein